MLTGKKQCRNCEYNRRNKTGLPVCYGCMLDDGVSCEDYLPKIPDKKLKEIIEISESKDSCDSCAFCGPGILCLAPWTDLEMEEDEIEPCFEGVYYQITGRPYKHLKKRFKRSPRVYLWKGGEK